VNGGTHAVSRHEFWHQLQRIGTVPRGVKYAEAGRRRVKYEGAGRRFILFAARCIIKNRRWINRIMECERHLVYLPLKTP
jgi:hypothetical protein